MKKLSLIIFGIILCLGVNSIPEARAASVTISTNADTSAFSSNPDNNYGTQTTTYVFAQVNGNGVFHGTSFFNFDISQIPPHSTINSAYLKTYLTFCNLDSGYNFKVSLLDRDWSEGSLTWNNQPQPVSSIGMLRYPCDATTQNTFYSFDISNLIQATVNGQYAWHGLSLSNVNSSETYFYYIDTKEQSPVVSAKLAVDFTPPAGMNGSSGSSQPASGSSSGSSTSTPSSANSPSSTSVKTQPNASQNPQAQQAPSSVSGKVSKVLGTAWPLWFTIIVIAGPILLFILAGVLGFLIYKRKKKKLAKPKIIKTHPTIKYK